MVSNIKQEDYNRSKKVVLIIICVLSLIILFSGLSHYYFDKEYSWHCYYGVHDSYENCGFPAIANITIILLISSVLSFFFMLSIVNQFAEEGKKSKFLFIGILIFCPSFIIIYSLLMMLLSFLNLNHDDMAGLIFPIVYILVVFFLILLMASFIKSSKDES